MVEWVARWYRRHGVRVAILSRGYGPAQGLNDEGRVLEENLPDVPHLQDPDRVRSGRGSPSRSSRPSCSCSTTGSSIVGCARDLDLVLLDALEPFGLGRLFPRGLLREPVRSLRRADVVVLSRADFIDAERAGRHPVQAERRAGPLRWVEARHAPLELVDDEGRTSSAR